MSKPLDPALLKEVASARGAVITTALLVIAQTSAVVAAALVLAPALAGLVQGTAALDDVVGHVLAFGAIFAVRALLATITEWRAHRAATRVIADLRERVLAHSAALGPRWLADHGTATATLVTRGLDNLEPYLVRYLPQLLQTAILTPAIVVVIALQDLLSAVTLLLLMPLIPVFMWLIGIATQASARRRLAAQQRLSSSVLDLVAGLPTLRAFGRGAGTTARVAELADAERRGTMATLRIAFLSGGALELLATLSVASVAVGIGLRLVTGDLSLTVGLAVLILAPEVLLPLRQVGLHFHASADGVAAVEEALGILAEEPPAAGSAQIGPVREVRWENVTVHAGERRYPAPEDLTGRILPGRLTVLRGASGSGKSTAVLAMLGLIEPDFGRVVLRTDPPRDGQAGPLPCAWHDLRDVDLASWHRQVAWVPQRPIIEPGTVAEAVGGSAPERHAAALLTGFDDVVRALPQGWSTPIGTGGHGLSAGQRQRLALTRTLIEPAPWAVLDEPTAHLDSATTEHVAAVLEALRARQVGMLVLTHDPEIVGRADEVLSTSGPQTPAVGAPEVHARPDATSILAPATTGPVT